LHISSIPIRRAATSRKSKGNDVTLHISDTAFARPAAPSRPTILAALGRRVALWRSRRALAKLPAHLLEDVGLTEAEAAREARRRVWDVPANWRD
jgi:uncharacterized protein YjiS (DUF1127 family)